MNLTDIDFHSLCLDEGGVFYTDIFGLDKEDFNQWMRDNLTEIQTIESYNPVLPNAALLAELCELGYEHRYYQCHYSAKALTILKPEMRYFTGFVERSASFYPVITHSFNILNETVIDFARIDNPDDSYQDEADTFSHIYYGMEIPRSFILAFEEETFRDKSMKPLLFEWCLENN